MNLKKLMNNRGYKRVKDDSLDDFTPGHTLRGVGVKGETFYASGTIRVPKTEDFKDRFVKEMDFQVVSFERGLVFPSDYYANYYFTVCAPNRVDKICELIDCLKRIGVGSIMFAIDKSPSLFSPRVDINNKTSDEVVEYISGK